MEIQLNKLDPRCSGTVRLWHNDATTGRDKARNLQNNNNETTNNNNPNNNTKHPEQHQTPRTTPNTPTKIHRKTKPLLGGKHLQYAALEAYFDPSHQEVMSSPQQAWGWRVCDTPSEFFFLFSFLFLLIFFFWLSLLIFFGLWFFIFLFLPVACWPWSCSDCLQHSRGRSIPYE